jgi:hypothetical protein
MRKQRTGRPRQIYTGSPLRDFQTAEKDKFQNVKASLISEAFFIFT